MTSPLKKILLITTVLTCLNAPAFSQETPNTENDYPQIFYTTITNADYKESFVSSILQNIRRNASDRKTLTEADIKKGEEEAQNQAANQQFSQIIKFDLNMDTIVTKEEIQTLIKQQIEKESRRNTYYDINQQELVINSQIDSQTERYLKYDINKDNKIDLREMRTPVEPEKSNRDRSKKDLRALLQFDKNNDAQITIEELEQTSLEFFAIYDTDKDGILSQTEKSPLRERTDQIRKKTRMADAGCDKLPDLKDSKIYAAAVYESQTLSTVAVGGQDSDTQYMHVQIADDIPAKSTLVLSSYESMIWGVEGNTKNIANLIVYGRGSQDSKVASGVIGIDATKTTYLDTHKCNQFNSDGHFKSNNDIATALQKKPDQFLYSYGTSLIKIAAAGITDEKTTAENTENYPEQEWHTLIRFSPGGIKKVPLDKVQTQSSKENYDVLPQEAGLAQLVKEGALVKEGEGYKIVKPIKRFPSGLSGAHSTVFSLGEGIPMPAGSPGHSCVEISSLTIGSSPDCRRLKRFRD